MVKTATYRNVTISLYVAVPKRRGSSSTSRAYTTSSCVEESVGITKESKTQNVVSQ